MKTEEMTWEQASIVPALFDFPNNARVSEARTTLSDSNQVSNPDYSRS